MEWSVEWNDFIPLLERSRRQGQATALDNRPELYDDLVLYWDAWITLSRSRQEASGLLVSEILLYADRIGVVDGIEFLEIVSKLDNAYLKAVNKGKKGAAK